MNTNKFGKLLLLPFIALATFLTSCEDEGGKLTVNIPLEYAKIILTVPADPIGIDTTLNFPNVEVSNADLQSKLTGEGASMDDLQSIKIKSVKFVLVTDTTGTTEDVNSNFNAIDTVETTITAGGNTEALASKKPVTRGVSNFDLDVDQTKEYKSYLTTGSSFFINASGKKNAAPIPDPKYIKIVILFDITAEVDEL